MSDFLIKTPRWKDKSVGLSLEKLRSIYATGKREITIEVLYKNAIGERRFPYIYQMFLDPEKIKMLPRDTQRGHELVMVRLDNLDIKEMI